MTSARLAVVFDMGAATPAEVGVGCAAIGPMVSVLGMSDYARSMAPMLEHFGAVVPLDLGHREVAGRLAADGVRGIFTFSERMLPDTAQLALALGLPGHDPLTLRLLTNKHAQRGRLRDAGVTCVRSRLLASPADWPAAIAEVGVPAVLKPVSGEGSRNTYRIDDEAQGADLVSALLASAGQACAEPALVVEEYLAGRPVAGVGDYVSVECASSRGQVQLIAVTGKLPLLPPFRETGQFWPALLAPQELGQVAELAMNAVRALGVTTGLTHTEIKLTTAGPEVIEVNGRLGGNLPDLARRAAAIDLVELAARIALGESVTVRLPELDRVHFQYWCPAPRTPGQLVAVQGVQEVRSLPGIVAVRQFLPAGARVAGTVASTWLGMICGAAADHPAMLTTIDAALGKLSYVFDTAAGRVELSAMDLRA